MEVIEYLRMLGRRWGWVTGFTVLGVAAAVAWVLTAPKIYSATAEMFVGSVVSTPGTGESSAATQSASQFTLARMPSYAALVDSPIVARDVLDQLKLPLNVNQFASHVSASVPPQTVLLQVTATDRDPGTAASLANATATRLATAISQLETPPHGGSSPVDVTIAGTATTPSSPTSPNRKLVLGFGLIVGIGVGLFAATVRDQAARRSVAARDRASVAPESDYRPASVVAPAPDYLPTSPRPAATVPADDAGRPAGSVHQPQR